METKRSDCHGENILLLKTYSLLDALSQLYYDLFGSYKMTNDSDSTILL